MRSNVEINGSGYCRNKKRRWQDDHFLRRGYLAILKGVRMKNKNVQIPYELFLLLLQYHLMEYRQNEKKIRQGLEKKMNDMAEREIYSRYKTASMEEEREKYRQEYLDRRGIPEDFRW